MGTDDIEAKRVFGDRVGKTALFVAADLGVAAVDAAGDRLGSVGIAHRCDPRDIAAVDGRLAIAAADDVLVGDGDAVDATGFGPAVAVGGDADLLAAAPDGRVARRTGDGWRDLGTLDAPAVAVDGDLLATDAGVYRATDGLEHVGLARVRDVSVAGGPLAATAHGLYALGNGWMDALDGDFRVVAASAAGSAHAASADRLYARTDRGWDAVELPVDEPVTGVAYGDCPYALTTDGTLLADAGDGWRAHALGLTGAVGIAALG